MVDMYSVACSATGHDFVERGLRIVRSRAEHYNGHRTVQVDQKVACDILSLEGSTACPQNSPVWCTVGWRVRICRHAKRLYLDVSV